MKIMLKYLKPFYRRMSVGVSIKIIGTLVELLLPYILSHILENVVEREDVRQIIFWGLLMVLCAAVACVCNIIANRMAAKVSRNFSEKVRHDLFSRTLSLSSAQVDKFTVPSLESRITTDTYNVHNFVSMMQRMGVRAPILLVGGIAITLVMDAYLALAMISILPFIFVTVYFISRKGVPLYTKVQESVDKMVRVVREDTQGIRVIKALSKTEYEHKRYDAVNRGLSQDEQKAGIIMGSVNPIMTLLMNMGIVVVVSLAAYRVAGHRSSPETVIAFMQYFTQISMAMMTVTRIFTMYTKSAASARRIAEVIEAHEDLTLKSESEYPAKPSVSHIEFENVSFSYKGRENDLENLSFSLARGGSLGIIGATGSGKTTLVRLLMRFYDVSDGCVRINGRDVRTIPKEELYPMFGVALQHDFLYADTVEENIKLGRDISHEEVVRAAKIAQADDFISAFPEGYRHMLAQKAANISGGQKQRLLIARAIAACPEILVLDDSSSALDYKTDANLRAALRENLAGTTVVTVAQRVSSVKDSDLILVLDEGKVIGAGKHDELLISCPEYREISESQMGGAFVE
ncbi:MAG: ABC transporter ATP-binding protein [Clostridia bacterium]|nr:ABC transporter ATP-binding protein [Clostridia bacterium]